ncbi:MAG: YicC/YloC family endoribonuclease, partial [Acidobacteriota bacterium]
MIQSMTSYGRVSIQQDGATVTVEVRTGNHRFLDLHVHLAKEYGFLETEVTQLIRNTLRRGRVDASVTILATVPEECLINLSTARSYIGAAAKLRDEFHLEDSLDLKTLLALPGVLQTQNLFTDAPEEAGVELREFVLQGVRQTLETVQQMRVLEGRALESEIRAYLNSIREKVASVRALMPAVLLEYRQRLDERLKYLLPQIAPDPQRVAQEVALLAEKTDISEEITRLESHLDQYAGVLADGREVGKKMDFLLQEMHREINTVLSKTGNLEVTRLG